MACLYVSSEAVPHSPLAPPKAPPTNEPMQPPAAHEHTHTHTCNDCEIVPNPCSHITVEVAPSFGVRVTPWPPYESPRAARWLITPELKAAAAEAKPECQMACWVNKRWRMPRFMEGAEYHRGRSPDKVPGDPTCDVGPFHAAKAA